MRIGLLAAVGNNMSMSPLQNGYAGCFFVVQYVRSLLLCQLLPYCYIIGKKSNAAEQANKGVAVASPYQAYA